MAAGRILSKKGEEVPLEIGKRHKTNFMTVRCDSNVIEEQKICKAVASQKGSTFVWNVSYGIKVSFLWLVKLLSASL